MKEIKVIDSIWFNSIGIVAVDSYFGDEKGWKCYIGIVAFPSTEEADAEYIARNGMPTGRGIALGAFPNLEITGFKSKENWEERLQDRFTAMVDFGIQDDLWTEKERITFMFVGSQIAEDFRNELSTARAEAYEEGIDKAIEIIEGKWASQSELKDDIIESIKTFKEPTIEK
jgi:hypothetical protein